MTEVVPLLSVGSVLGDSDRENMEWKKAINSLGKKVRSAREGLDGPLRVNVVFHVDGRLVPNEFVGIRTGRFSRKDSHLMVQVAVPVGPVEDRDDVLWTLLTQAVEAAEVYAKRKKIADALPELLTVLDRATSP